MGPPLLINESENAVQEIEVVNNYGASVASPLSCVTLKET